MFRSAWHPHSQVIHIAKSGKTGDNKCGPMQLVDQGFDKGTACRRASGKKIVPRRYRKKCSYICRSMCFRPLRAGYIPNSQAQAGKFDALITERLLRAVSRFIAITAGCIPIHKRDARLTSPRWRACGHWGHQDQPRNAFKFLKQLTGLQVMDPDPFT